MKELAQETLHKLAKIGAQARLDQIESERRAILAAFPDLQGRRLAGKPAGRGDGTRAAVAAARPRRTRRMTAAQRKEVSDRMKKYWAERRKGKG